MDYEQLRVLADTWGLVFLVAAFVGVLAFVFRKGAGKRYRDAASIPFRHEDGPANAGAGSPPAGRGSEHNKES